MPTNIVLTGASRRALSRLGRNRFEIGLTEADETTRKIARAYARAWKVASREARAMAAAAARAAHDDQTLSPRDIARMDRIDRGLFALERQIRGLDKFTGVTVSGAASRTLEKVAGTVFDDLAEASGIDRRFTQPSAAALEGLVLRSTGRIEAATRRLDARQALALKDGLMRGLLLGENPKATAKHIFEETEGAFFGGLSRATTLARTEMADANRYATRLAYTGSPLVVGWKWCASLSDRTCPACWALHNSLHETSEMQYGHQNCRCTMVPVLADDEEADHDLGNPEEIFWTLPRETQAKIMGNSRLQALEAGAPWEMLATLKHNPSWRPSFHATNVRDLQGLAELATATTPGDVITVPGFTNASLLSMAYAQGGMTVQTSTGDQPTEGFAVAFNEGSEVIDAREFFGPAGPTTVAAWLTAHGDVLDEPGMHMGMWYDTANGKVVLDIVKIVEDRAEAIALGRAQDQIAIFDLGAFEEIATGGSGGYTTPKILEGDWQATLDRLAGRDLDGLRTRPTTVPGRGAFVFHSNASLQAVANAYNAAHGFGDHPRDYARVDPERAELVAEAFENMKHDPDNPEVKRAYDAMKRETLAQYEALVDAGYSFDFYPAGIDPYRNSPREAIYDLTANHHMSVYPTIGPDGGFGEDAQKYPGHPLLEVVPGLEWDGRPVTYNDVFRGVHDAMTHAKEGLGFGPRGEDNAFRQHYAMYSPEAQRALAAETRGQNTWVNFGPHGEHNRADPANTIYAPQKAGLLPEWASDPEFLNVINTALALDVDFDDEGIVTSPVTVGHDDVGKSASWHDGSFAETGTIVKVNDSGSVRVRRSDGSEVIVWPDQFDQVGSDADKIRDDLARTQRATKRVADVGVTAVNLTRIEADAAEEVADSMVELRQDWPEIKPMALSDGPAGGAFAVTKTSFPTSLPPVSVIDVATPYAKDPAAWQFDMAEAEGRGHFHEGTSDDFVDYTIDHEFGHVADFALFGHPGEHANKVARHRLGRDIAKALGFETTISGADLNRVWMNPAFQRALIHDLSGYALSSMHELFAEGFAVYRDHGPGVSKAADVIMATFARRYHQKYGKWPNERGLETLLGEEYEK